MTRRVGYGFDPRPRQALCTLKKSFTRSAIQAHLRRRGRSLGKEEWQYQMSIVLYRYKYDKRCHTHPPLRTSIPTRHAHIATPTCIHPFTNTNNNPVSERKLKAIYLLWYEKMVFIDFGDFMKATLEEPWTKSTEDKMGKTEKDDEISSFKNRHLHFCSVCLPYTAAINKFLDSTCNDVTNISGRSNILWSTCNDVTNLSGRSKEYTCMRVYEAHDDNEFRFVRISV